MIIVAGPDPEAPAEPTPPPRPRPVWLRFQMTWTGTDGTAWDLYDGPVTVRPGASGFGMPLPTHWHDESPSIDGAHWQGMRTGPREVFLPVQLAAPRVDQLEAAFFAGLNPRHEGALTVTSPEGRSRSIRLRYSDGAEGEFDIDPLLSGDSRYPLRFTAADPYWHGDPVYVRFEERAPKPSGEYVLWITSSNSLASAKVTNPGDVDAYPVWRMEGPFTAFTVGVGDSLVAMTLTKAAGEWVEVDMDPRRLTVVDESGVDRWDDVDDAEFSAIPPGAEVDLTTSVTGAVAGTPDEPGTAVELSFPTRYRRAW